MPRRRRGRRDQQRLRGPRRRAGVAKDGLEGHERRPPPQEVRGGRRSGRGGRRGRRRRKSGRPAPRDRQRLLEEQIRACGAVGGRGGPARHPQPREEQGNRRSGHEGLRSRRSRESGHHAPRDRRRLRGRPPPLYCHTPGGSVGMEKGILGRGEGRKEKGMVLRAIYRRVKSGGVGVAVGGPDGSARADVRRRGTAKGFVGRRDGQTAVGSVAELMRGGGADVDARAGVRCRETGEGFGDRQERHVELGTLGRSSCNEAIDRAIVERAVEGRHYD